MYKKYEKCCVIAGGREVPAETFAVAHPSGCRRHLPFTRSWVTTGLHRDLYPPLNIHVDVRCSL